MVNRDDLMPLVRSALDRGDGNYLESRRVSQEQYRNMVDNALASARPSERPVYALFGYGLLELWLVILTDRRILLCGKHRGLTKTVQFSDLLDLDGSSGTLSFQEPRHTWLVVAGTFQSAEVFGEEYKEVLRMQRRGRDA